MTTYESLDLLLSAGSLLAVGFVVVQIATHNRQMHHDFEAMYLQRFWALMERRSPRFDPQNARRLSRADRRFIEDYLALSNDQIELRRLGRVTNQTWRIWAPDIAKFVNLPAIRGVLDASAPEDFADLRRLIEERPDNPTWDPCELSRFRRWARGL